VRSNQSLLTPTFILAFAANFFAALNFTSNAIYPLYVTHEGGGAESIGLFMGLFSLAAILGRPIVGILIDRWGIRPVWLFGMLCLGLPSIGYYFILGDGLTPVTWILRAIQGFGFGAHFTAFFTLGGVTAPLGRQSENISKYGLSGIVASFFGPFMCEQIFRNAGPEEFFLTITGFGIIAFILILFIKEDRTPPSSKVPDPSGLIKTFRVPGMRLTFVLAICMAVCFATPSYFIAPVATERGIQGFGLYFTAFAITGTLVRVFFSHWGDKYGPRRILIPGFFIYAIALLTLAFSSSLIWIFLAGLFAGLGHGVSFPAVTALGFKLAPKEYRGSAMAVVTGMMDTGSALAAFSLGKVAGVWGYDAVFPVGLLGPVIAILFLLGSIRRNPIVIKDSEPS